MRQLFAAAILLVALPALAHPGNPDPNRVAKKVEKAFQRLDVNRDGFITRAEVDQAIAATGKGHRLARHFAKIDGNRDGAITRPELAAAIERRMARRGR